MLRLCRMMTIEESKLFTGLSPGELQLLRSIVQEQSFPVGAVIFNQGDPGNGLYVVRSGVVQIASEISQSDRRSLSRILPGESFGDMAVLDQEPRSATASAEQDTEVYFIPREDLLPLLEKIPRLAARWSLDPEILHRASGIAGGSPRFY